MSEAGPDPVTVEPLRQGRWVRRELWFVLAAILVIAVVALGYRRHAPSHVAPGAPVGGVPTGVAAVPVARPAAAPAS